MQRGLFRYDVTACETKVYSGILFFWSILLHVNWYPSCIKLAKLNEINLSFV